ncbi:polysaccharide biosynthesis/export family protein [uncultured Thioclava sp.]|uniref:polysaccharide biosynthesis/export family protein n=1 Tax=uncultured Thioclava sp. TaxID=473858 RepID=UPI0025ECE8CF|nr:polysaccharide biosynthesis/export family protein [uncultured Thioclava sp.]
MRRIMRGARVVCALGAIWLAQGIGAPVLAETLVERGDVLYVAVVGTPEMTRDARVDADGRVRLPLVGGIPVAGSDLDEISARIKEALVKANILLDPVVLVEISTYRPIYIGGAVKRSGAVPYEPGLTVRHALIAAGGLETATSVEPVGIGQVLELLARQRAASLSLAQTDSEIARLKAQLAQADAPAQDPPEMAQNAAPDAPAEARAIQKIDSDLLRDLSFQRSSNLAYAKTAVKLAEVEIDVLEQQATFQKHEQQLQHDEVERTRTLVERGLVPLPQLMELQREDSRLSRDLLENYAFAARARQSMERIRHETSVEATQNRIKNRESYRAALRERAALQSELDIIAGHLLAAGQKSDPQAGIAAVEPNVVIYRRASNETRKVPATMETPLEPGDIVELNLPDLVRG